MELLDQIQQQIADEAWEELIQALTDYLDRAWNGEVDRLIERVRAVVEEGGVDTDRLSQVLSEADADLGRRFEREVAPGVMDTNRLAYRMALAGLSADDLPASGSVIDERVIRWLDEYDLYWIRSHYSSDVRERLASAVREVQEERLLPKEAGARLAEKMQGAATGEQSRNYWELTAAAVTVRSRELATVEAMARLGVDEYRIVAVIDRRTSDICRYLDGKTYDVADAVAWRERMLSIDRSAEDWPERAKEMSPWLPEDKVVGRDTGELAKAGVVVPPFHGHCRSTIEPVLG